jgi:hypothetical protein
LLLRDGNCIAKAGFGGNAIPVSVNKTPRIRGGC